MNEPAPFQLHLQARQGVPFSDLPVSALLLFLGGDAPNVIVQHKAGEELPAAGHVTVVDVGQLSFEDTAVTVHADLRAPSAPGRLVVSGAITSATPRKLEVRRRCPIITARV